MKGNDKIAFTAEGVALMRARENADRFSKYFTSPQMKRKLKFIRLIVPSSYLNKLFHRRVKLSQDIDKLAKHYKPQQIIELASGYSPRGLIFTQKNPKLVYIETDFPAVINRKRKIFDEIENKEHIKISKNHHLIGFDAISGDLYNSIKDLISKKKRTLIIAETLTIYLNPSEHNFLIKSIERLLDKVKEGAYLGHEGKGMLKGFFGKLLLFYRDITAKTRSYKHFTNSKEIKDYFLGRGFKRMEIKDSKASNNIIYLAVRK